jgi:hypothetical protein
LWFVVTFILLPAIGAFFAVLAHSQCSEIDAKTCVFVGFAAPSLLQKWSGDSLNLLTNNLVEDHLVVLYLAAQHSHPPEPPPSCLSLLDHTPRPGDGQR